MAASRELFGYLTSADLTDVGRKRKRNEDSLIRFPESGVFCVADGMGGEDSGDVASKATVDAVREAMTGPMSERDRALGDRKRDILIASLRKASGWIQKRAAERGRGMSGSTVVVLIFDAVTPEKGIALHAGDSRLYRYREGDLSQVTRDHSLAEEAGFKSRKDLPKVFRGMVTRGVGIREDLNLEETPAGVRESDLFLLCSDGLSGMVPDKKLRKILRKHEAADLDELARILVSEANDAGGDDNCSVVLIRIGRFTRAPEGELSAAVPEASGASTDLAAGEPETADTATATPPTGGGVPKPPEKDASGGGTAETLRRPAAPGILSRLIQKVRGNP